MNVVWYILKLSERLKVLGDYACQNVCQAQRMQEPSSVICSYMREFKPDYFALLL